MEICSGVWRSRTRKTKSQKKSEDRYRGRCMCVEEKKHEEKRKKKRMDEKKKKKKKNLKKERETNIKNKKSKLCNITIIFSQYFHNKFYVTDCY